MLTKIWLVIFLDCKVPEIEHKYAFINYDKAASFYKE
jgi:hypothetical protein